MKKIILALMIVFALLTVMPTTLLLKISAETYSDPLEMSENQIVIVLGSNYQLDVNEVDKTGVEWKSDKPAIATVDSTGSVTGKNAGTTTIRATYGGETVECQVTVKLADITGAKVARSSNTALKVSWTKVPSASGYVVYRSTSETGTYKAVKTITKGSTVSFTNTKLKTGTTYYYKVRAYKTVSGKKVYGEYTNVVAGAALKTPAVKVAKKDFDTIKVSWKKLAGASGYEIYRSTSKKGTYTYIDTVVGNGTVVYDDIGLVTNKTYYYKVRAYKEVLGAEFYGANSAIKSTKIGMNTPAIIATPTASEITISWKAINGAEEYEVYRSTSEKGKYTSIGTTTAVTYADPTGDIGKAYYYKVRAMRVDGSEKLYSGYSKVKGSVMMLTPNIKSVKRASDTSLKITWDKVTGASGYVIYRSTSETGTYKAVKTITKGTTLTYTNTKLKKGTAYYYKIKAYKTIMKKKVYSIESSIVAGITLKEPTAPTITVTSKDYDRIQVGWNKLAGVDGYEIYRCESEQGTYELIETAVGNAVITYDDKTVILDKTYYYKVRAYMEQGAVKTYGPYSAVKSTTVTLNTPVTTLVVGDTLFILVTWNAVSGATYYELEWSTSENGAYALLGRLTSLSLGDNTVPYGATRYYRVRAVREEGTAYFYSSYSDVESAVMIRTPTILGLNKISDTSQKLWWYEFSEVDGYEIHRSTKPDKDFQLLTTITDSATTSYTDTNLSSEIMYYYKMKAYITVDGKKVYGKESLLVYGTPLNAPIIRADQEAGSHFIITWNLVPGATHYELYRSTNYGPFALIETFGESVNTYADLESIGNPYHYKMKAVKRDGSYVFYSVESNVDGW